MLTNLLVSHSSSSSSRAAQHTILYLSLASNGDDSKQHTICRDQKERFFFSGFFFQSMVCFKSILRKAQAHSGQEFQPSRHWGQVNRFTYLGPRIVWLQGANNRWRCFRHLATSFWKSTFYIYKSCNISVADSQFQTLNCLRNMFAKPIYFNICWIVIRSLNEITDPNHFKICKYIIFRI